MKQYYKSNNSNKLLIFFSGWGCDEYAFEHLNSECDILIFYDYLDLNYNFDFSKYHEINILAFSAGVFVGSIFKHDFKINKKLALSGNPYLFDDHFGISESIQEVLCSVTEENADEFLRNYLIKSDEEYKNFHCAKRSIESCNTEFNALKKIYNQEHKNIKDTYDFAIIGKDDIIFNFETQKEYYRERLKIIPNARHNLFYRFKNYDEIFDLAFN